MNLLFNYLELDNFCSYAGTGHRVELSSPASLIYITGVNKAQPSLASNDLGKSTLINALYWVLTGKTLRSARPGGAVECWSTTDTVRVVLHFAKNGIDHVLVRERRPNNLTLDGQTVSNENILVLLGLSEEAIKNTIIIGQFNDFFLDLRPEQQSQLFAELLNLQIYEEAAGRASQQVRQLERRINDIEKLENQVHGQIMELTQQITSTTIKKDEFEATKAADIIKRKAEKTQLKQEIKKLKEDLDKIIQDDKGLPDISEQEELIKELSESMGDLDSSVVTLGTSLARNHKELQMVEAQLNTYRNTNNICPECGQEVDKDHIAEKIEGYSIRRRKLLDTIESEELIKKKRQRRRDAIVEEITSIADSIQEARVSIAESKELRTDVTIKLNQLWDDEKYLVQKLDDLVNSKNPHEDSLWELHERKRVLRRNQREFAINKTDAAKTLASYEIWAKAFKEIRLNLIDDTLMELEFTVNKHIAALGLHDWEVGFETERETSQGKLVSKMTVNIFPPDRNEPVSLDALGGGVTTRIQLGIFFGLSEILLARAGVLPNIEWLDEPCKHLSDEGVGDLLECLRDRARETGRTIYVIEHKMLDHSEFDSVIWIEKDADGSRISSP